MRRRVWQMAACLWLIVGGLFAAYRILVVNLPTDIDHAATWYANTHDELMKHRFAEQHTLLAAIQKLAQDDSILFVHAPQPSAFTSHRREFRDFLYPIRVITEKELPESPPAWRPDQVGRVFFIVDKQAELPQAFARPFDTVMETRRHRLLSLARADD